MSHPNPIIAEDIAAIADRLGSRADKLAGTRILITGGAGFLLSYVVDLIAHLNDARFAQPASLTVLDNMTTGMPARLAHLAGRPDITLIQHDVREPYAVPGRFDFILHGASIASPMIYRQFPLETIDANVTGTRHMLDRARSDGARFLLMSTSEIYGDPDPAAIPTPETYRGSVSCTGPRACYDESKRLAETLLAIYAEKYGVAGNALRPFNFYGPGQRLDDQRIVPDLMSSVLKGEPITLFSDGRATRSFCYITDAITGLMLVWLEGRPGEPYNIGNEAEVSIGDVARLAADLATPALSVTFKTSGDAAYLTDNPQRRCPDLTKARAHLDYHPLVSLERGLARTLRSYRFERDAFEVSGDR
jgi:dTDP-glucose 4,6-dehydratase/UDP-glucuronate decarboxylase